MRTASAGIPWECHHAAEKMKDRLRDWARVVKRDVHALYLASRDPRVPWYAKAIAVVVAGYALSPIDLIPDFIPGQSFKRRTKHHGRDERVRWVERESWHSARPTKLGF